MTQAAHPTEPQEAAAARALLDAGAAASRSGESHKAIDLFDQASAVAPAWALPHFLAASEYASLHDWSSAEMKFARAVALDPGMEIARYQYGLLQFTSGKADAALVVWQPLLASAESPWLSDFVMGFAAVAAGGLERARECFESGLRREGVNPAVASDIHQMLEGMVRAQGKPEEPPDSGDPGRLATASHVLVSNYDKLKLH